MPDQAHVGARHSMRRELLERLAECALSPFMAEALEAHTCLLHEQTAQRPATRS
jgi:hypothetical protein